MLLLCGGGPLCLRELPERLTIYHSHTHAPPHGPWEEAETFGVFGYMSLYHEVVLRRWLPVGGKQYRQLDRRLHINVTRFVCRSEVLSRWTSNEDIIDAMHASMVCEPSVRPYAPGVHV